MKLQTVLQMIVKLLYLLSFLFGIGRYAADQLHIFQLNSYKHKVQRKWMLSNKEKLIRKGLLAVVMMLFALLVPYVGPVIVIGLNLAVFFAGKGKHYKKPLVYTARVKRLLFTLGAFFALTLTAVILLWENKAVMALLPTMFFLLLPFLVLLADWVNKPVEKGINRWYIKDAGKILASMDHLVVIGVTGSYGKTSVKFFLSKLLSAEYNVLHTPESFNTPLGIVRTVRGELKAYHDIFVCEMGAKNIGDIKEICDIVHPRHGVITSIGPQHLESFGSIDNVLRTKFELADALPAEGFLFLNYDNEFIRSRKQYPNIVSYGIQAEHEPDYLAYDLRVSSRGTDFKMKDASGTEYEFTTKLIGTHNVENIAGVIAVANRLGISMEKLVVQVKQLNAVEHRLQLLRRADMTIIDDAYNSNPSGAEAALQTFSMFSGVKILLTPGMVELGSRQYECNKVFGEQAARVCDYVILVGEEQTKPIYDGVTAGGFDPERLSVVPTLEEGFAKVRSIKTEGAEKILLIENDLPDNY